MQDLRDRIAANLAAFARLTFDGRDLRRAAVAILLSPREEVLTYVLTRRAAGLRRSAR